jgi:hypothetical protein
MAIDGILRCIEMPRIESAVKHWRHDPVQSQSIATKFKKIYATPTSKMQTLKLHMDNNKYQYWNLIVVFEPDLLSPELCPACQKNAQPIPK